MSGFLFIMAVEWVMTNTLRNRRRGLSWRFTSMLEDLDYADDIALTTLICRRNLTDTKPSQVSLA